MKIAVRLAVLLVMLAALVGQPFASADAGRAADAPEPRKDHDRARRAVQAGQALPLAVILPMVQPSLGGEVIEVEFERDDGIPVYEFKVLTPSGRMVEVKVDAASGRIVEREED